jgi:hypothetical protein
MWVHKAVRQMVVVFSVLIQIAAMSVLSRAQDPDVNVLVWQYDLNRSGQNLSEATLVSPLTGFGQLCKIQVDGQVYAQPLVVADVVFNNSSSAYASVVYAVTENDTVYAINGTPQGTSPTTCNANTNGLVLGSVTLQTYNINGTNTHLYQVDCNFIGDPSMPCQTVKPYVGILGTPVISLSGVGTGTLYLVTENQDTPPCQPPCTGPSNWYHWLHALNIQTLQELSGYPIRVYPPPPYQHTASFFSETHIQRPGLLYVKPYVYIAFSMMDGLGSPLPEGWLLGYDTTNPGNSPLYFSTTQGVTGSAGGGIWQGGQRLHTA